ncbi:hypothetical protein [Mitsuaria sp. 7]|uniref:hypothetical protein n=1 Tax=Mitsuaria sp. 7 TaxID=1658665 RepID=UPI0007DDA972|nr:hypothetical protein [Mitsuaria sp. 7]ANH66651.1 hypothetical protein ABE85_02075 [Mitsuaria sp. 7]
MNFLQFVISELITTAGVLLVAGFLAKELLSRSLQRQADEFKQSLQDASKAQELSLQFQLGRQSEEFKQQLQVDAKTRELMLKAQIDFRERQLGELYGPIYALICRWNTLWELEKSGRLTDIESETLTLYVASNDSIVNLLLTKSHLVDGERIPDSSTKFLTHVAIWHAYMKTKHKGVPFSDEELPQAYYPQEFSDEIVATTVRLKRELYELHRRYGVLAQSVQAEDVA